MPRELLKPGSPYWEKCARHQNPSTTRFVAHIFLCDGCTTELEADCLNGRPPLYEGTEVDGYCGLCNNELRPRLRQWFICPICFNVVLSYPKGFAASQHVHDFWRDHIAPALPQFHLDEMERVQLEPFVPRKRSQKIKAETVKELDFRVSDASTGKTLFYIELKAGPTGINEMTEFQLDVNDFNDIAYVYNSKKVAVYVFHVQINDDYKPPTRRSLARNLWWTDVVTLDSNRKAIRHRRGEDKQAGYYKPEIFLRKETFADELRSGRYLKMQEAAEGKPLDLIS